MKTILEHLRALPEPFRSQAISQARQQNKERPCQASAIDTGVHWASSKEGADYWRGLYRLLNKRRPDPNDEVEQHPDFIRAQALYKQVSAESGQPEEVQQHTTPPTMDTSKYSNQPVANPTLVFGTDVSTLNPDQTMAAIKGNNSQIKTLEETGISSPYITERINGLKAANEVLVKHLDSFAATPTA
jgi:hypothetical protein